MPRLTTTCLLALALLICAGCHHAGTIPPSWLGKSISSVDDQQPQPQPLAFAHTSKTSSNNAHAQLQVFICYGNQLSNHTALRLTVPDKQTLMWDPGGTYLQNDPSRARRHDVITQNAPTVNQWWHYRRDGCREPVMEVFQWSIDPRQANRLHAILLDYQDPNDPTQTFEPDAGGLQCCKKVSEFLMRFTGDHPHVTKKMFWPHKLGEHLWTQNPDSVMVFRSEGDSLIYRRDAEPPTSE